MPVIKVKSKEVKIKVPLTTLRIEPTTQSKTVEPSIEEQTITPDEGIFALSSVTVNPVTSEIDENIKAENIKDGVSILGVGGTVEPFREPVLQDKTVNPTSEIQEIIADEGYDGLNKVVVNAQTGVDINDYLETTITNANHNNFLSNIFKKFPKINVETNDLSYLFYMYKGTVYPELDTKNVVNMDYMLNNNAMVEAPYYDTSSATSMYYFLGSCTNLTKIPLYDTSKNKAFYSFCASCTSLKEFPPLDLSSAETISGMFANDRNLVTIPELNCKNVDTTGMGVLQGCSSLVNFGGFKDIGMAYGKSAAANYGNYQVYLSNCVKLTEQSLINALNGLYDIASKGCKVQKCVLGSTNLAKLTSEEGQQALANATAKGWTVS